MRKAIGGPAIAAAAGFTFLTLAAGQAPPGTGRGPQPAGRGAAAVSSARFVDGHPNLNGVWEALNTANWNLQDHPAYSGPMWETGAIGAVPAGQGVVEGNDIPYLPAALEKKKKNFENRRTDDPEAKCY